MPANPIIIQTPLGPFQLLVGSSPAKFTAVGDVAVNRKIYVLRAEVEQDKYGPGKPHIYYHPRPDATSKAYDKFHELIDPVLRALPAETLAELTRRWWAERQQAVDEGIAEVEALLANLKATPVQQWPGYFQKPNIYALKSLHYCIERAQEPIRERERAEYSRQREREWNRKAGLCEECGSPECREGCGEPSLAT